MVITTSCIPHALLQRELAAAPLRGGVSPCPFTVQILWLLGPANHGGNDVVPILGIALYWSSIFWLLPLGSQPPCKHVTSLTLPQAQAAKRGLGEWDVMWRSQGAPWCCPHEWRSHCGNEPLAPATPLDARGSRENSTAEPFQNSWAVE